jgi:hypothetical protein
MFSRSAAPATLRAMLAASVMFVVAACGGPEPTPTPPIIPGTLAVAVAPATLSLVAGTVGTSTATITRGGSFTGDVALTAEGAPSGVTVTFASTTLGAGVTSSVVTVATTTTLIAGSYPVAIKASGTGVTLAAATLTLTVTAPPPPTPTLGLTLTPATTSIVAGTSGTSAAAIVRGGGFTGPVTLTAAGAPNGMTIAYSRGTIPDTASTSTLTVTVGSGVAPGPYTVVVTAAGTGVTTTASLAVTVTAPVIGNSITVQYCTADAPKWVAYQDGTSGAWTQVLPAAGNTYTFSMPSGKGGLAVVDTVGNTYSLSVTYASVAEFQGFDRSVQAGACGFKTINGSVAGVVAPQAASVSMGFSTKFLIPILSNAFTLTNVAGGLQNVFAARLNGGTQRADKMILRRGVSIDDGGTLATLDFNATEAFAPQSDKTVTVGGIGNDSVSIATLYNGAGGSTFGIIGTQANYTGGLTTYDAVPVTQMGAVADNELQQINAVSLAAGAHESSRTVGVFFRDPINFTFTMGAPLSIPTVTRSAATGYSLVRVQLPVQTDYTRAIATNFTQVDRSAGIFATSAYTGGAAWDLSLPTFPTNIGWDPTWGLKTGASISWSVSANGGALYLLDRTVVAGTPFRSALRLSTTPLP